MARRKLELGQGFTIWRDAEFNEYIVKLFGDKSEERAYFTNDLEDARGTGIAMVKEKSMFSDKQDLADPAMGHQDHE